MTVEPIAVKLAQITDTHLFADREASKRGIATGYSLRAVLDRVVAKQPDGLLLTGDLADEGDCAAYDYLYELIAPLQIPAYWIPGNHDRPGVARQILSRSPFITVTEEPIAIGAWNLILLDSTLVTSNYGEGAIASETLDRLGKQLVTDRPTAIALHHHPLPMGIDWLDTIGVTNAHDFLARLQSSVQFHNSDQLNPVKVVLFGHTHLEFAADHCGIQFYGTPSTCAQVLRDNASETDKLPGFRWLEFHPDGSHHSEVIRVPAAAIAGASGAQTIATDSPTHSPATPQRAE